MACPRTLVSILLLPLAFAGSPAPAQDVHPATRADWISECNRRLQSLNRNVDTTIGYEATCRAWLGYYERVGATAQGYDFGYAIPVQIKTETVVTEIMADPIPRAVPERPRPHRRVPLRDKRVRL